MYIGRVYTHAGAIIKPSVAAMSSDFSNPLGRSGSRNFWVDRAMRRAFISIYFYRLLIREMDYCAAD